jgi:cbb3-type cytochrome oxidase subunit 3
VKFENSRALIKVLILFSALDCFMFTCGGKNCRDSNAESRLPLQVFNPAMKADAAEELRSIILLSVCWAWTFSTVRFNL